MRAHWILAGLAAFAAAGCDRPTPVDLQPPVDRDRDGYVAGVDCDDGDPAVWISTQAYVDGDHDHVGAGALQPVCAGALLPAGWSLVATDCDDGDPAVWTSTQAYVDGDEDGYGAGDAVALCVGEALPARTSPVAGDCDDLDPLAWRELAYLYRDADGDGVTVMSAGVVCYGQTAPAGFLMTPSGQDCDDVDPEVWASVSGFADADGDHVGAGDLVAFCTSGALPSGWAGSGGDCAAEDPARWRWLAYAGTDADGDGYTVPGGGTVCAGVALPAPYRAVANGNDCDDGDLARWQKLPGYVDEDLDGRGAGDLAEVCTSTALPRGWAATGGDCAPQDPLAWTTLTYHYRDRDLDGWRVPETGDLCIGSGWPATYGNVGTSPADCDDADPHVWTTVYGYFDADLDGSGAGDRTGFCTDGALPARWVRTGGDCAPDDGGAWRLASYSYVDRDGDGYTATTAATQLCVGTSPPDPYRASAVGNDCDDAAASRWRWVVIYPDKDGDGVGAPPREIQCLGATIPDGYSTRGWDANDASSTVQSLGTLEQQILIGQ